MKGSAKKSLLFCEKKNLSSLNFKLDGINLYRKVASIVNDGLIHLMLILSQEVISGR